MEHRQALRRASKKPVAGMENSRTGPCAATTEIEGYKLPRVTRAQLLTSYLLLDVDLRQPFPPSRSIPCSAASCGNHPIATLALNGVAEPSEESHATIQLANQFRRFAANSQMVTPLAYAA